MTATEPAFDPWALLETIDLGSGYGNDWAPHKPENTTQPKRLHFSVKSYTHFEFDGRQGRVRAPKLTVVEADGTEWVVAGVNSVLLNEINSYAPGNNPDDLSALVGKIGACQYNGKQTSAAGNDYESFKLSFIDPTNGAPVVKLSGNDAGKAAAAPSQSAPAAPAGTPVVTADQLAEQTGQPAAVAAVEVTDEQRAAVKARAGALPDDKKAALLAEWNELKAAMTLPAADHLVTAAQLAAANQLVDKYDDFAATPAAAPETPAPAPAAAMTADEQLLMGLVEAMRESHEKLDGPQQVKARLAAGEKGLSFTEPKDADEVVALMTIITTASQGGYDQPPAPTQVVTDDEPAF